MPITMRMRRQRQLIYCACALVMFTSGIVLINRNLHGQNEWDENFIETGRRLVPGFSGKYENTGEMSSKTQNQSGSKMMTFADFKKMAALNQTFMTKVLSQHYYNPRSKGVIKAYLKDNNFVFDEIEFHGQSYLQQNYDITNDVIVFLHVQKTGGLHFDKHVTQDLVLPFPCKCDWAKLRPCLKCLPPNQHIWMYNSAVTSWPAGLHADWTRLHSEIAPAIDKLEGKNQKHRRYFYMTQIRDPVERYLSEWQHVHAGNAWQDSTLSCGGTNRPLWRDVRPCFISDTWEGVSLDEFMACKFNLASNRMTRMLADLAESGCYNDLHKPEMKRSRSLLWLQSAKANIQSMEYFRLFEYPRQSDTLFTKTFKLKFKRLDVKLHSSTRDIKITEEQFMKILQIIELDIQLYVFAKQVFFRRLEM